MLIQPTLICKKLALVVFGGFTGKKEFDSKYIKNESSDKKWIFGTVCSCPFFLQKEQNCRLGTTAPPLISAKTVVHNSTKFFYPPYKIGWSWPSALIP